MIDLGYVQRMARYNRWQNENLYGVADTLSTPSANTRVAPSLLDPRHAQPSALGRPHLDEPPREHAAPDGGIQESVATYSDWNDLKRERAAFDKVMLDWADRLDAAALEGDLVYFSRVSESEITRPKWSLVTHMFNHQTHHRGQVHCMLTQAGGKPGDTDLPFMPM
jgi:uncharacterized damage-inducible protein DinB